MSLGFASIVDQVTAHVMTLGLFDRVNQHEPKNSPGNGLTGAVWLDTVRPVNSSGLSSTSGVLIINIRIYTPMLSEPFDYIDVAVTDAVDAILTQFAGDLTLGGRIRSVDLRGSSGTALSAQAGYVTVAQVQYRVVTITLPLIVNDVWEESA